MPHFVSFFSTFIPNKFEESVVAASHLSNYIIGIIDGTVHRIQRPSIDQHLYWNEHYQFHTIHSLFLIGFDGSIKAVETGIPGSFPDSPSANFSTLFQDILGPNLAMGDTGFAGVDYIVAGFTACQLKTAAHKDFDRISRSEQVKIEHVNNFVKKCKTLSKTCQFIHTNVLLCGCVIVGAGLYNYMLYTFGKCMGE